MHTYIIRLRNTYAQMQMSLYSSISKLCARCLFMCWCVCDTLYMCKLNNNLRHLTSSSMLFKTGSLFYSHWLAWRYPEIFLSCHRSTEITDAHYCPHLYELFVVSNPGPEKHNSKHTSQLEW